MSLPDVQKNPKKYAELFLTIEEHFDVNNIQIDNVHLWPLIRGRLRKPQKEINALNKNNHITDGTKIADPIKPHSIANDILKLINKIIAPLKKEVKPIKNKPDLVTKEQLEKLEQAEISKLKNIGQVDYVIFGRPNKYYQTLTGKRYAPILDPVYEDLSKVGNAVVLCETDSLEIDCLNEPVTYDIEPTKKIRKYTEKKKFDHVKREIDRVKKIVTSKEPELDFDTDKIIFRYNSHAHRKEFFKRVLKNINPEVVFFSSFTSWVPVIWACKELSIPTVDIQHGGQGSHHGFNTHYSCVPENGYHMLPDFFWCWGFHNKAIINRWFPGNANRHIPVVGGNRWKAKWIKKDAIDLLDEIQQIFINELKNKDKVILITLSHGVDNLMPEHLKLAMKASPPSYYWLIRLHPINRSPELKSEIKSMFHQRGIKNFEIEQSTNIALHYLLQHIDYHLSPFSTAVRESVDFGVASAIIDPIGAMDFSDDIKEGRFGYAESAEKIITFIDNTTVKENTINPGLETDDKYVSELLNTVKDWKNKQKFLN